MINIMFDGIDELICAVCNGVAYIRFDKRYNGMLGFCPTCQDQWKES